LEESGQELTNQLYAIHLDVATFGNHYQKQSKNLHSNEISLFSDVVLLLGEERIPAHRIILASWSPKLKSLLENKTWNENEPHEIRIEIESGEFELFKMMLLFIYTGHLKIVTENVVPLMALSHHFGIVPLKEACGEILGQHLGDDNVFYLLHMTDKFQCASLRKLCAAYLAKNFQELLESGKMLELNPETWTDMLKSDDLQVTSEEVIFNAVLAYVDKFDKVQRDKALELILPSIRFPLLPGKFLVQKVESNKAISHLPVVKELLYESFRYKAFNNALPTKLSATPRKGSAIFDMENVHNCITISEDGKTATLTNYTGIGWCNQIILPEYMEGDRYIELKVNTTGPSGTFIGIGPANTGQGVNPGSFANSVGWQSTGYVYHPTNGGSQTLPAFYKGSRIGIFASVSGSMRTLTFYLNGKKVGTHPGVPSNAKVYPLLSFYSQHDSFTILPTACQMME